MTPLREIADGIVLDDGCGKCVLKDNCPGYYDGCFEAVNGSKTDMEMTKTKAIALEKQCEELFKDLGDEVQISMALTGKLKVYFNGNFATFDMPSGNLCYIHFTGDRDEFAGAEYLIKKVVLENQEMLEKLKWSYDHRNELAEG